MMVVVTAGATSRAKLQSNHHHQQTNTQFFYRPDTLPLTQPTVSKHSSISLIFNMHNAAECSNYPNILKQIKLKQKQKSINNSIYV